MFEVNLTGNSMLPIVKHRSEFECLSRELEKMHNSIIAPLRITSQDATLAARDIQTFLDALLFAIGLDENSSPQNQSLLSFLGLRFDSCSESKQEPMEYSPLHNQPTRQAEQQEVESPISIDERAAAREAIRRRREAAHSQRQAQMESAPKLLPHSRHSPTKKLSAEEKANVVRQKMMEALNDSAEEKANVVRQKMMEAMNESDNQDETNVIGQSTPNHRNSDSHQDVQSPEFSFASFCASLQKPVVNRRALRQAMVLLEQTDTNSKLKTWVNLDDEDAGLTFTQSLTGESFFEIIPLPPIAEAEIQPAVILRSTSDTGAPAPIESSSTTSSRVAAVTGYTASFRDIRSKFANAAASIADQEYASSRISSPENNSRTSDSQASFTPKPELIESLVAVLQGEDEAAISHAKGSLQVRAGIVLCNLCLESPQNREMAIQAGLIEAICRALSKAFTAADVKLQAVALSCLANLATERKHKDAIVQSSVMSLLVQVLIVMIKKNVHPCTRVTSSWAGTVEQRH